MNLTVDITEYQVHAALRSWLLTVLGGASFYGSTALSSLSVVTLTAGTVEVNQPIVGPGIPAGTYIASLGVNPGDYVLSTNVATVTSQLMASGVPVIQELDNRVPMPEGGFVLMDCISKTRLGTGTMTYEDDVTETSTKYNQSIDYVIQLDFYGDNAGDWVAAVSTLWRSPQACEYLRGSGIQPLYHDDAKQISFVDGENQYQHRWILDVHLQYTPTVTTSQQFFNQVGTLSLINVDVTYP